MFDRFKRDIRAQRFLSTAEEAMYFEQAAKEVAAGEIQAGLPAMALSKCEGDEVKANAMYLQLRVDMLRQEAAVGEKIMEAAERQAHEERKAADKENISIAEDGSDEGLSVAIAIVVIGIVAGILIFITKG